MRFSTLSTLAAITNIIYAAPAAVSSDATTPPSSLPSITGSLRPTGFAGSAGMPRPSANCTNGTDGAPAPTDFNAAAAKTGLPTVPITIINNTVANLALQGTGTGLPTIPISIINNTVATEPTGAPDRRRQVMGRNPPGTFSTMTLTGLPSSLPTGFPEGSLSFSIPSGFPTEIPSGFPTGIPSGFPTEIPSGFPTEIPSGFPTGISTEAAVATPLAKRNNVAFPYCEGGATGAAAASIPVNKNDENNENAQAELL